MQEPLQNDKHVGDNDDDDEDADNDELLSTIIAMTATSKLNENYFSLG